MSIHRELLQEIRRLANEIDTSKDDNTKEAIKLLDPETLKDLPPAELVNRYMMALRLTQ